MKKIVLCTFVAMVVVSASAQRLEILPNPTQGMDGFGFVAIDRGDASIVSRDSSEYLINKIKLYIKSLGGLAKEEAEVALNSPGRSLEYSFLSDERLFLPDSSLWQVYDKIITTRIYFSAESGEFDYSTSASLVVASSVMQVLVPSLVLVAGLVFFIGILTDAPVLAKVFYLILLIGTALIVILSVNGSRAVFAYLVFWMFFGVGLIVLALRLVLLNRRKKVLAL